MVNKSLTFTIAPAHQAWLKGRNPAETTTVGMDPRLLSGLSSWRASQWHREDP
jgi:hypothetical protein